MDRVGRALSTETYPSAEAWVDYEELFEEFRKRHLLPLTDVTLQLQSWLRDFGMKYYLAQRLKRKPQILRKLRRLHVRLTQLQDVGGCRIILEKNGDIDQLEQFLTRQTKGSNIEIKRRADYREKGRDDSGYRALHLILEHNGVPLELQVRSKIQHYWAESIERTSVIYGRYLKEQDGDTTVLSYFKHLSDVFSELESGRKASGREKLDLERERVIAEEIIRSAENGRVLDSFINNGIVDAIANREQNAAASLNNWLLIFDWRAGSFVDCEIVSTDADQAVRDYSEAEQAYSPENGFEVVMIGSSDLATIRETHSHYFGIETYAEILENLDESIVGFTKKMDIDIGARQILLRLHTRRVWGKRAITASVIKNHLCKKIFTFDSSLATLIQKELVIHASRGDGLLLNMRKKAEIERYIES